MKKILYIFALITSFSANAQDINPTIGTELCPNQEYTFTVSGLPDSFSNINTYGGANVTLFPSGSGTTVTFKGTFSDVSGAQVFTLSWANGGSKEFKFSRIKSLFGGYSEGNNPTSISAPICNTNPVTLSITGQYWSQGSFSTTAFGNISKFKYLIPSGWYLNGTLSTGSNFITAVGTITLTPNATTGGVITYYAMNDCSGAFFEGTPRNITINRGTPTFSLSPSSLQFNCGTPKTQTFTITQTGTTTCGVSYVWNIGAGWLYNGSTAPASISTTATSITLTSANGNVLPGSVSVTPYLGGNPISSKTCTTAFSTFTTTASIAGLPAVCLGTTGTYSIAGLPAGTTVSNWQSSNTAAATVTSNGVVTAIAGGNTTITATLTNSCGQTVQVSKAIGIGAPSSPNGTLYSSLWMRKGLTLQASYAFPAIIGASTYTWTIEDDPNNPVGCSTGRAKFVANNSTTSYTSSTPSANVLPGSCVGTYIIKCTVGNNCGSAELYVNYLTVGNSGENPCYIGTIPVYLKQNRYVIENPIKGKTLHIKAKEITDFEEAIFEEIPTNNIRQEDTPCWQEWPIDLGKMNNTNSASIIEKKATIELSIYDMYGKQLLSKTVDASVNEFSFTDTNLTKGNYILHINDGVTTQKEIIVVE